MEGDKGSNKPSSELRRLLKSPQLEFLIEAHSGLSAKIATEAGFAGIWASSLSISAQLGVRDSNEASWTQVLEVVEFMADATGIPILLDGDTGYGDFNITRRVVRKLGQRNIAGLCIEDKVFPKRNSLLRGKSQELVSIEEFVGKIKAVKDNQFDPDFSVVARTEALIAGRGMAEALDRAHCYCDAGADAILIHSSKTTAEEVLTFKHAFGNRCPVVIVPTKYYSTPTQVFEDAGFSIVIWANHLLRASISAMTRVSREIYETRSIVSIEDEIAPISEIFRLQVMDELTEAQRLYLPSARAQDLTAIILAATRGKDLGDLTAAKPKAMIEIAGRPLLERITSTLRSAKINDIVVVRGYRKTEVNVADVAYVDNDLPDKTGELVSLQLALEKASEDHDIVVCYGDVLFRKFMIELLLESDDTFTIIVDSNWQESNNAGRLTDYVACTRPCSRDSIFHKILLTAIDPELDIGIVSGEWTGFFKVKNSAIPDLRAALDEVLADGYGPDMRMHKLLHKIVERGHEIRVIYTTGSWLDVDTVEDVVNASRNWKFSN